MEPATKNSARERRWIAGVEVLLAIALGLTIGNILLAGDRKSPSALLHIFSAVCLLVVMIGLAVRQRHRTGSSGQRD